jgi:glycosyltransferase involved in cell wall biosynthesis
MGRQRILWASHSSEIGGAELCLCEGARGLVERGHQVHVVLPSEGPLRERLHQVRASTSIAGLPPWTRHPSSRARRFLNLASNLKNAVTFATTVRAFQPDVVVTNTVTIPTPALVAKLMGIPHVWYIHEYGDLDHGLRYDFGVEASMRYINFTSDRVIVNSKAVKKHFQSWINPRLMKLCYYAMDIPMERDILNVRDDKTFNIVVVGRKQRGKGQEDAIRAVAILRDAGCELRLTLIGGGGSSEYGAYLKSLVQTRELADTVCFIDHTDDPHRFYLEADVALMCSRREAFGRVTIEAMKHGVPVIGAASGGTEELIRDGWNGRLYHPGDEKDLAAILLELYGNRQQIIIMGNLARKWSRTRFTRARYAAELDSVFESATKVHSSKYLNAKAPSFSNSSDTGPV